MIWENINEAVCCFSGHRRLPANRLGELSELLDHALENMIHNGVRHFRTGGALGFDTLAALKVLDLKERFSDIQLELYLPCRDQDALWQERDRTIYREILCCADRVHYVREQYVRGCMLERNRKLVEGSSFCICFCSSDAGGTAYTLKYAQSLGVGVINLANYLK